MRRYTEIVQVLMSHWIIVLLAITALAIMLRSLPAWLNTAWGNDFGIYYGLTTQLIEGKSLLLNYDGWGSSYQYFPVLYIVTAAAHWISGIDILVLMPKVAPIFGGLSILVFYFLVYELTQKRKLALLSSAFLAVTPFHVYQTSHAAPLTMGHFFMMLCLLFFVKFTNDKRYFLVLLPCTFLLVLSHHLTSYFFLITLCAILVFKSLRTPLSMMKYEIGYLLVSATCTFGYWLIVAVPIARFIFNGSFLPAPVVILLFYALLLGLFFGIWLLQQRYSYVLDTLVHWRFWHDPSKRKSRAMMYFFSAISVILIFEIIFLFVPFPVSGVKMTPLAILYSLPLVFFMGVGTMSLEYVKGEKNHWFFQGWLYATVGSFLYSLMTMNHSLFPDRHIEYIMVPVSFVVAVGLLGLINKEKRKITLPLSRWNRLKVSSLKPLPLIFISFLVFSNAVAVYPVYTSLDWIDESIPDATLNTIEWIDEHLNKNTTVIATDLRLSRLLWASDINGTYEYTNETWISDQWHKCFIDLDAEENHSRVTHILIDNVMNDSSINVGFYQCKIMNASSYEKFQRPPFALVYRNATLNPQGEEIRWAEVYEIDWLKGEEMMFTYLFTPFSNTF